MNNTDKIFKKIAKEFADVLSPNDIDELAKLSPSRRASFILEKSPLTESEIAKRFADIAGVKTTQTITIAENPQEVLPIRIINEYECLPCADGSVAIAYPPSEDMTNWITAITGKKPNWVIAPSNMLEKRIADTFGVGAESLEGKDADEFSDIDDGDAEENENAAIIKFVNELIVRAKTDRATDIHIEPQKNALNIRFRIDGNLVPLKLPENVARLKDAIISRIKIMSRLNISEKRRPQDGRIAFSTKGEELDIRVSSLPTLYGESISLRLLTQKSQPVTIQDLGFTPEDIARISQPLARPHGIILVTGPTGSGKSTTLTAFIRRLRSPEIRIITVEDPVEYEVEGVNQTQVHPEIGLTFSSVLRSVLRQDPDVVMVGEIRDRETADIAIRASLTGHLVLSTLHTNDAAGALTRLTDMEIEPFLLASSVEMILAQRLVRRLCHCAEHANIDSKILLQNLDALAIPREEAQFANLIKQPKGCDRCKSIGYFGRIGIFEILLMNDDIHKLIVERATAQEIRRVAEKHGMRTLQRSGWELVKNGETSMEEIMYYANITEDSNG
ncbi:MAG: type II/IV secretion system protein [Opitutales bacterium]|nr:type II/IV secretion system protein [Opitutales bacterium]